MLSQLQIVIAVMQPVLSISFSAAVSGYSTGDKFHIRILVPLCLKCLMHSLTCVAGVMVLLMSRVAVQLSGLTHVFSSTSI